MDYLEHLQFICNTFQLQPHTVQVKQDQMGFEILTPVFYFCKKGSLFGVSFARVLDPKAAISITMTLLKKYPTLQVLDSYFVSQNTWYTGMDAEQIFQSLLEISRDDVLPSNKTESHLN